jgi:ElaB/YqjD/DUF883 family membrane-anchored ribosome-binding protein
MTDITSIQERFREKASEASRNLADMGHPAKEAVQGKLHDLQDKAGDEFTSGKVEMQRLEEGVARKVHESPVKSLLVAFGIGAVLSFLWRRR